MDNFVGALILLALYFLPSIVALARSHGQTASILVINLFLGWTVIGWIVALAMAVSSDRRDSNTIVVQTSTAGAVYQSAAPEPAAAIPASVAAVTTGRPSVGSAPAPRETPHEHQWVDSETTNRQTGEVVRLRRCTSCGFIEAKPAETHAHTWGDPLPGDEGRLYQECAGCKGTRYIN